MLRLIKCLHFTSMFVLNCLWKEYVKGIEMPYQGEFLLLLDALGGDIFIPTNIFELGESG